VTEPATIETEERDGVFLARLSGEIDLANAGKLGQRLRDAIPNEAVGLVIDLTETTYLDSSGVSLVFDLAERLKARQQQVRVVVAEDAPLRRVLRVVNLESVAPIVASQEDAVAAIRQAA